MNYDSAIRETIDSQPIDALIAAYVAGTLTPSLAALVAAHLELKPENRAYVAALEAVEGVLLQELRPVPLAGRDRRLVDIFASLESPPRPVARPSFDGRNDGMLPLALRALAGCEEDLHWRARGTGVKEAQLPGREGSPRFVSAGSGKRLPIAPDDGLTTVLVLAGCASDGSRDYRRGDVVFINDESEVAPIATGDEDCLCFVVGEASGTAESPFRRALQRVTGG